MCVGGQCQACSPSTVTVSAESGSYLPGIRGNFIQPRFTKNTGQFWDTPQSTVDSCAQLCNDFVFGNSISRYPCQAFFINQNGICILQSGAPGFGSVGGGICQDAPNGEYKDYGVTFVKSGSTCQDSTDLNTDTFNCGACGVLCNQDPLGSASANHVCTAGTCQPCPTSSVAVTSNLAFSTGVRGNFFSSGILSRNVGNVGASQEGINNCADICAGFTDFACSAIFVDQLGNCIVRSGAPGFNTVRGDICARDLETEDNKFQFITFV